MHKGRLEAFSDGVIAIIITIMVLELKVPHSADLDALAELAPWTVAVYGGVLILAAIAYTILVRVLLAGHDADSHLARAIGSDFKGRISLAIYAAGIGVAFWQTWLSLALYVLVAIIWLVPDRRIEKTLSP